MIPPARSFPRESRIRRSREFRENSWSARRHATEAFVVLVGPSRAPSKQTRLGITVSRKVGNAVVRNRVKRRIREWFRRDGRTVGDALDIVVIARPAAAQLGGRAIAAELSRVSRVAS